MAVVEYLRQNDYDKMVEKYTEDGNIVFKNLMIIATRVGLRINDLLNLTFEIVDKNIEGRITVCEGKTKKNRGIKLNEKVLQAIEELRAHYKGLGYTNGGYLFKSQNRVSLGLKKDVAMVDRTVNINIKKVAKAVGVEYNIGSHSLRKKFGRDIYINSGENLSLVQTILQHSSPKITLAYIGIEKDTVNEAYDLLD